MIKKQLIFAIPLIILLVFVALFGENIPHQDDLCVVDMFEKYHSDKLTADRLFRPHNQHLMPIPNLLFLWLGLISDFNLKWYLFASVIMHTIGYVFLMLIAAKLFDFKFHDPPYWMIVLPVLHFNLVQFTIFLFGFNLSYIMPLTFFYASLYCAISIGEHSKNSIIMFSLSVIFIIMGAFSSAMGYFAVPAIFMVLLFKKQSRSYLIPLVLISLVLFYYIANVQYIASTSANFNLYEFQEFIFQLMGFPVYNLSIAYYSGIFTVLLLLYILYFIIKNKLFSKNIIFISMIIYCLMVLLVIAYGRHNMDGAYSLSLRYNAYKIPIYIAIFFIIISLIRSKSLKLQVIPVRIIVIFSFMICTISSIVVYSIGGPSWEYHKQKYGCILLNADSLSEEQLKIVFPDKNQLMRTIKIMKKYKLSIYSDDFNKERLKCHEKEYK